MIHLTLDELAFEVICKEAPPRDDDAPYRMDRLCMVFKYWWYKWPGDQMRYDIQGKLQPLAMESK